MEALQSCKISERQLCVKWVKLFRFPSWSCEIRGESQSRLVSLADLAMGNEPDVLLALQEGGIHGFFLRAQISVADPTCTPSTLQSTQIQD